MTSPNTSSATSEFQLSFNPNIDALLDETHEKWGGALGSGANLSFSFPWLNGKLAWWQSPSYSTDNEPGATQHFGFNAVQVSAARSALQAWADVANLQFTELSESSTNVGDFRFAFSSAVPSSAWGWASYPNDYWASAADVWVNTKYASEADWSVGSYNFEALMHEIGHGLGLKHPGNYGGGAAPYLSSALDDRNHTIMSYNDENDVYPEAGYVNGVWDWKHYYVNHETPMVLDIAAIQYLYGANNSYRVGNDTYTFDSATPFYRTIWDAGGTDTIDVGNYTLGCVIDLTPGHYSSLRIAPASNTGGATPTYDGTDCLGIAYDCLIENAIGGTGNDTFVGNQANNGVDGGAGSDTCLYGGARSAYSVTRNQTGWTVFGADDGTDSLDNVERLHFSDKKIALDIAGNALETLQFIGVIAPQLSGDMNVRGTILSLFDQGKSMQALCQLALDLGLITSENTALAKTVYKNVFNTTSDPDQGLTDTLVNFIAQNGDAKFLATVAGLNINVDFVGLQQNGMAFL